MLTVVFALLLSAADSAPAALAVSTLPASTSTAQLPKLYGTVETPGDKLASVVVPGDPAARWFAEGDPLGVFVLKSVTRGKITLARNDGTTVDVFLEGSQPSVAHDDQPAPFSRKWINSRANPMLHHPAEFGSALTRAWRTMSKEEREAVFAYYKNHGWRIARIEIYEGGGLSIEWENIYAEERQQVVRENSARWRASLTEAQRDMLKQLDGKAGRIGANMTEEQKRDLERRKDLSARFSATLTPEQKAERASIEDFTKGKW